VERIDSEATIRGDIASELKLKQQIFEKVRRRMSELEHGGNSALSFCSELNPDVIVISDDQSLLFEPQNQRALELLTLGCGLASEELKLSDRIRVHPCKSRKIIEKLKAVGVTISGDF